MASEHEQYSSIYQHRFKNTQFSALIVNICEIHTAADQGYTYLFPFQRKCLDTHNAHSNTINKFIHVI
ncbi:hypothetical protein FPOA_04159 [Fusarium poae]|uniref:Uncharacterized protein n=1 Tax=Fusarium poae TaxID=36050 RepID=A0A1B8ASZ9_FUSPO|nr:hypothetical protein FPOA_04159 [Fusarium poae]